VDGDTDAEVLDFVVDRYGEFVLLNPPASGSTLILWLAGPAMLIVAGAGAALYLRGRRNGREPEKLSATEQAELDKIIRS